MASEATNNQASCMGDREAVGRLTADRRALHRIPEISFDLPRTIAYVEAALAGLPCEVEHPCRSCVTAFFDFGRPSSVGFRCDMDALPVSEATGRDFASELPGRMHACGHDGHMAIMLETARQLSRAQGLPQNVLLVFQPAEEGPGGGELVCESGILERHGVRALFGLHLWPDLAAGHVETRVGPFLASCGEFDIDVTGKAAHAAHQDEGVDALAPACRIACRVGELAEGERALGEPCVVNVGHLVAGTIRNVVAGSARLEATMRTFRPESRARLTAGIERVLAEETSGVEGLSAELSFDSSYPAVINPAGLTERVLRELPWVERRDEPSMIAEDFAFYQQHVPAVFFFLGTGTPGVGLHSDTFDFDEGLLVRGVGLFSALSRIDWSGTEPLDARKEGRA
jgi:hippurate hydrolase